ncbi:MAG: alpha/beta hydrolase [Anaerolineae bacterium]|nr:alpha/beta hydrolase [Anaerolineae bacterium]
MSKRQTNSPCCQENGLWRGVRLAALGGALWIGWKVGPWLRYFYTLDVPAALAAHENRGDPGLHVLAEAATETYTRRHTLEDGIERIVYTPAERRYETPILLLHGMWHAAWCWQAWQEALAGLGWESVAVSLPGHAGSPPQRPMEQVTLDYYLGFLKAEVERFDRPPVLMGHSMGGALTQWYLKYVGQEHLAAAVLVAAWVSHSVIWDGGPLFARLDPAGMALALLEETATPFVRTPGHAARLLLSPNALITPEALFDRLGPESVLVMMQHNPPFWSPAEDVSLPLLWLAAEKDGAITVAGARRSAAHYGADFVLVPDAGHNLMHEHNRDVTVQQIHEWLAGRGIA